MKYTANAFCDALPNGKGSGDLEIEGDSLIFSTESTSARLPLEGLQIKRGGAANRLLFFTHPSVPQWTLYTTDTTILKNPYITANQALNGQVKQMGKKQWLGRSITISICLLILAAIGSLYFLKEPIAKATAAAIPASAEQKLGETAWGQMSVGRRIIDTPEITSQLETMVQPLIEAVGSERYTFQIYLMEEEEVNAFALPGGVIVLHTGLILEAENTEEILGVLAHEIAHVTMQHGMRNMIESAGLILMVQTVLGDVSGLAALLGQGGAVLLQKKFSRDFEREADELGLEYLVKAKINPRGLVTFFEKLQHKHEDVPGGEVMDKLSWISTHPATEERIADLEKAIDQLDNTIYQVSPISLNDFQESIKAQLHQ